MRQAESAIEIDSTGKGIAEVVQDVLDAFYRANCNSSQ
jgi:cytidylate kinase